LERGFLQRHPELVIRTPETTSLGRTIGFNEPAVRKFFELYKAELDKHYSTADKATTQSMRQSKEECHKKKQTRTKDKRQNRKLKTNERNKNQNGGVGEDDTPCLCGGLYTESAQGWIQCTRRCQLWAHNSCAGVDSQGDVGFVCELCE